jgi:ribokinase
MALSAQKPIVVVGSINTDLVALTQRIPFAGETVTGTNFQIHSGGKGANQAVAVARLGYPVRLIGCVGDDGFGAQLRIHLEDAGVDIACVATTKGTSGVALIVVSSAGENCIVVTPGANAKVTPEIVAANIDVIRQAGMVLAQLEIPIETIEYLATICGRENVPLILDPAPARDLTPNILKHVTWFTPNQIEAAFFSRIEPGTINLSTQMEIANSILAQGCRGVVLKMGSHGSYIASQSDLGVAVPAFPVQAVDTTAAGDAFNGGFATGLMLGKSPFESATFAAAVAGISVTRIGAQPAMPNMAEVQDLLKIMSTQFKQMGRSSRQSLDDLV